MFSTTTPFCRELSTHWLRLALLLIFSVTALPRVWAQSGAVTATQNFTYTGQIETWQVPSGVTSLTIEALGAAGAANRNSGRGAILRGVVAVTPAQTLSLLVGGQPQENRGSTAGGGGGSFVVTTLNNTLQSLVIAGGGGGGGNIATDSPTKHGQAGTDGGAATNSGGIGGTGGNGGLGGRGQYAASGGGGVLANGIGNAGGQAFVNGGQGGRQGQTGDNAGFGGGGSSLILISTNGASIAGGGGGGYSGGGGASANGDGTGGGYGGGGGSYNIDPNGTALTGATQGNAGNGLVTITYVPPCTPFTVQLSNDGPLTCVKKSVTLMTTNGPSGASYTYSPNAQASSASSSTATGTTSGDYSVTVTISGGCSATATTNVQSNTVAPNAPSLVTQSGYSYPAGVSSLTINQNVGPVSLTASGCSDGQLSTSGGPVSSFTISTAMTGTQTYTATCTGTSNGCTSPAGSFQLTVVPPTLTVSHLDATSGQFNTNTIKPFLQLNNVGGNPIPYNTVTVRYYLTVEGNSPITNFQTYYVQIGANNVQIRYVPLAQPRQGANAYVEYSFSGAAGSLSPMSNSGPIQNGFLKADYSAFNQADDYSFVTNRDYNLNPRITAYINGQIVYGQEPAVLGSGPVSPLTVSLTATTQVFSTADNTTLIAQANGGSGVYSYVFSGPGTITPNGNTAVASGQSAGVKTFTVVVSDTSTPTAMQATATVSVTVTGPPNTAPVATANANQTATVGVGFSYTVQAFTDQETPSSLTYSASIVPANGLSFNATTRVISGTPVQTGVSSVTVTATDPGGLSGFTSFSITVNPAPVMASGQLTVYHLDATYGQMGTNTIKPYLQLSNTGQTAIPYSSIKLRYYLTKDGSSPITNFETYYVQLGAQNVRIRYVALPAPVMGADAYIEYSFDGAAGSLAPGASSGPIQTGFLKQDYSAFDQSNDYSYMLNRDYALNTRITGYVNNQLVFGTPPTGAARVAAGEVGTGLSVKVLGNPVTGSTAQVEISGAEGQRVTLSLTDLQGRPVHQQWIDQAGTVERVSVPVGGSSGLFLLQVATPTQRQQIKLMKP